MNNKKEFISKTLTFIVNSIFINVFAKVFGMENTMVAVSIVVVALTLAAIDMKQNLLRRSLLVTFLMLMIVTGAALATTHPLLGFIINFVIILGIVNQLFDHYKGSYYFPFLISYIFLLMSAPISPTQLPRRAVSVLLGGSYILLVQWAFNRNRYNKTMESVGMTVINDLSYQIIQLQSKKRDADIYHKTNEMMPVLAKAIYDNKVQGNGIHSLNKGYTKLIMLLDDLNQLLYHIDLKEIDLPQSRNFLEESQRLLQLMKEYINGEPTERKQQLTQMQELINNLSVSGLSEVLDNYILALKRLVPSLLPSEEVPHPSHQKYALLIKSKWRKYDFRSYHFKFALKIALTVSLTIFLVEICHITYGRWLIFPMIAIIQPYYDTTLEKAKHRVSGTLLGILLFTVLFTFIKDATLRLNLTILTAYIGVFITKYQYSTALVAISALGSSALQGGGIEILYYRILFTLVGCLIAMFVNRYICHYKKANIKEDLIAELSRVKDELTTLSDLERDEDRRDHLLIDQKLIECKLRTL